jgi:hypothetical protein
MGGFEALAAALAARRPAAVVGDDWALISRLAFALPPGIEVFAAGDRWALVDLPQGGPAAPALFIRSARRGPTSPEGIFAIIGESETLVRARRGIEAERYGIAPVASPIVPLTRLPRPR